MDTGKITLHLPHGPDNGRNSEGAFATLADGTLLFAYTRYRGESGEDHAPADIVGRTSGDGGRTWSGEERMLVSAADACNVMSPSLLRLRDGALAVFYLHKNDYLDCRLRMRVSRDESHTWSDPVLCIPAPGYFIVNCDRVIRLSSGRIVVPAAYHRARIETHEMLAGALDWRGIALFFLSDDDGATWRESAHWLAFPRPAESGLQEPGAIELRDGRLLAWCRTKAGCQYQMVSTDGGEQWSLPAPSVFRSPQSPLSMKRVPATGDLLAVWNDHAMPRPAADPADGAQRRPLAFALSRDDGASWEPSRILEDDPARAFCYTAIHFTEDAVLLAYCCGAPPWGLNDLCIRRLPLEALRG